MSILGSFYSRSSQSDGEIHFSHEEGGNDLAIQFSKDWIPITAATQNVRDCDVGEIISVIDKYSRYIPETKRGRAVLFSYVPVDGHFEMPGRFRIMPVPADWPHPPQITGRYPFLLEYEYSSHFDNYIEITRQLHAERMCELILSLLVNGDIASIPKETTSVWVAVPELGYRTCHAQIGYHENVNTVDAEAVMAETRAIRFVDTNQYYNRARGIGPDDRMEMPGNIVAMINAFYSLELDQQVAYLRALYWFQKPIVGIALGRSATALFYATAIEALIPPTKMGDVCKSCNRPSKPGPTKAFVEFVDQYSGHSLTHKERKKIYGTRSDLSHGARLFLQDELWGMQDPKVMTEMWDLKAISQVCRFTLINWLAEKIAPVGEGDAVVQ